MSISVSIDKSRKLKALKLVLRLSRARHCERDAVDDLRFESSLQKAPSHDRRLSNGRVTLPFVV